MIIEIKKSIKPIKYEKAISFLEKRLDEIHTKKRNELIWILEHHEVYTAGTSYKDNELLDKSINLVKTNRGGKITYHGPGQLVFYFVIVCIVLSFETARHVAVFVSELPLL